MGPGSRARIIWEMGRVPEMRQDRRFSRLSVGPEWERRGKWFRC